MKTIPQIWLGGGELSKGGTHQPIESENYRKEHAQGQIGLHIMQISLCIGQIGLRISKISLRIGQIGLCIGKIGLRTGQIGLHIGQIG